MNITRKTFGLILALVLALASPKAFSQDFDPLAGDGLDFSQGFSGWTAMTGQYSSDGSTPNWNWNSVTYINNPTSATDDNGNMFVINTDVNATDPNTLNQLTKIPTGFTHSAKLKNQSVNTGWAGLQYTMAVSDANCLLTFKYAMVLQAPNHEGYINPTFQIDVMEHDAATNQMTNNLVEECAFFEQVGDNDLPTLYPDIWHANGSGYDAIVWCNWQTIKLNLSKFVGNRVTIRFRISVCDYHAHWGYGYLAAKAEPALISVPGCSGNGDTVTVATAPEGFAGYSWFEVPADQSWVSSQGELANIEAAQPVLGTEQSLVVTQDMMGNELEKYYAVKMVSPRTQTTRPNCVAYIKTKVLDIRPVFNLQVTPPGPDDPAGRTIFAVNDVDAAGAPIYWQQYDFGDGTPPIELQLNGMIWEVVDEAANPATTYERTPGGSVERIIHTYAQDGTYTYTRTVRSSEDPLAETLVYCEKFETTEVVIPKVPSLVLTAVQDICYGETASVTATSPDEEGTDTELIYQWWHSREAIANEPPLFEGTPYEAELTETTTVFCKVTNQETGYSRTDSIIINVEAFPEVTLDGATKLCMGDMAVLSASDATGNAIAFEWTFTRPSNPPIMNNASANAVLEFSPTKDTTVYLLAETSAGCIAYDSVQITVINPQAFVDKKEICPGESVMLSGENAVEYAWTANPPDPSLTTERVTEPVTASPEQTTVYTMSGYGESGCHTDRQVTVTVFPYPVATIATTPSYVDVDNPVLSISDVSPYSASSAWVFSDGGTSEARSLAYSFNDLSVDSVSIHLTSYNKLGCWDSTSIRVPIELFAVWMPNAFSPNGDGVNDRIFFSTQNRLEDVRLQIFNRQGAKLFEYVAEAINCGETADMTETLGWDGTFNGEECPQGTYVYRLSYRREGNSRVFDRTGTITIVK